MLSIMSIRSFFFNVTTTTKIYTLSLHDALPISPNPDQGGSRPALPRLALRTHRGNFSFRFVPRSEEHTSELQSQSNLVCRLLLEKKKSVCKVAYAVCRPILSIDVLEFVIWRESS